MVDNRILNSYFFWCIVNSKQPIRIVISFDGNCDSGDVAKQRLAVDGCESNLKCLLILRNCVIHKRDQDFSESILLFKADSLLGDVEVRTITGRDRLVVK